MSTLFNNTEVAFKLKSNNELKRAYFLFKMIANPTLVKLGTSLTNFALTARLPVEGMIKSTVFDHFCGGVSEIDCLPVIKKMGDLRVSSVLDYSVEGKATEEQFDAAYEMTLNLLQYVKDNEAIPFAVFKPTGFGRIELYEKIGANKSLSEKEQGEWKRIVERFEGVCSLASQLGTRVLVDAEESWMQDAADDLVLEMMKKYNKKEAIVYNTLQLYRHDRLAYLKKIHNIAKEEAFYIGMKLVRGAYMEKEAARAEEMGYATPICKDKPATDANFNAGVKYMLENNELLAIFAGTHNEYSSYLVMDLMKAYGIAPNDKNVCFGQLYGMSDHISFNLANEGYNVAKYLPFGPVKEVVPYLIRRAQENTSVAGQTTRELDLLKKERKRRNL